MIKRIVKLSFRPEEVENFKAIFKSNWQQIRHFKGCLHVELLQDINEPNVFFTYSLWESEEHLDNYRQSELFAGVWGFTRKLFSNRPQAWSVNLINFD